MDGFTFLNNNIVNNLCWCDVAPMVGSWALRWLSLVRSYYIESTAFCCCTVLMLLWCWWCKDYRGWWCKLHSSSNLLKKKRFMDVTSHIKNLVLRWQYNFIFYKSSFQHVHLLKIRRATSCAMNYLRIPRLEQHWPETTSLLQSTLLLLLTNPKSYRQFVESLEASTANNNVCSSETNGTDEEMMSQSVTYSLSVWWGKKL